MDKTIDQTFDKAELWREEAQALRAMLLECGLIEALKWNKPCYTHDGANICMIQRMNDFLALMFFKGALLEDADGLLKEQGPNSRSVKRLEFASVSEIAGMTSAIKGLVAEAIDAERQGLNVGPAGDLELPAELVEALDDDPKLAEAFHALTPGRQRGYCLHISGAARSATRAARIEKYRSQIMVGKGVHDHWR